MNSAYTKCGRFEGVAYLFNGQTLAANYTHGLDEAFDLLMERYPGAKKHEVVEHEYDGFAWRVFIKGDDGHVYELPE